MLLCNKKRRSLEWVIEDDVDPGRAATLLARKISQRLPSFGEAFTQQVPLTRIRDIAHRGDIPHVSQAAAQTDGRIRQTPHDHMSTAQGADQ